MFQQIDCTLMTVKTGIELYSQKDLQKKDAGLRNAIVFGRAVTNALQKLKGNLDKKEFNNWYDKWQDTMKSDPGMKQLYNMRSQILKEGILDATTGFHISYFNTNDMDDVWKLSPPGTESFFMGDPTGGSGFIVRTPDGEEEKYYINLPKKIIAGPILEIKELPTYTTYDGSSIENTTQLLDYYYKFLTVMVNDAKINFLLNQ